MPPIETEFRGWLTPGHEAMLPTDCPHQPGDTWRLYAGKKHVDFRRTSKVTIVESGKEPGLWLDKTTDGIALSGDIIDQNGVVVRLDKNEFIRTLNSTRLVRDDPHSLAIYDRFDRLVLLVKYLNPSAIYLTGTLRYPDGKPLLTITDDDVECAASIDIKTACEVDLVSDPFIICGVP